MKPKLFFTVPWQYSGAVLATLIALFLVGCAGGSAKKVSSLRGDEPLPRPTGFPYLRLRRRSGRRDGRHNRSHFGGRGLEL